MFYVSNKIIFLIENEFHIFYTNKKNNFSDNISDSHGNSICSKYLVKISIQCINLLIHDDKNQKLINVKHFLIHEKKSNFLV